MRSSRQEKLNMNTMKTTRRQLLAQISAVAVAGGAVTTTTAAAPIGADADAQLIVLGEQLGQLHERELELRKFLAGHTEKYDALFDPIIQEISALQRAGKKKRAAKVAALRDAQMREAMGPEWVAADHEHDRAWESIDEIRQRMFVLPAHTLRGLAVKAMSAAYEHDQLWAAPFDDLNPEEQLIRHLIEAVLALAGEPLPFAAPVVGAA
jgi:hypothetical protein